MSDPNRSFNFWMGVYIPAFVCILGIIGNILSFIVLSYNKGNYPTFFSLKALAAWDILLLFTALWVQVVPITCTTLQETGTFCMCIEVSRIYLWPVICIAQMNSIWLTVIISAERYRAICCPLRSVGCQSYNRVRCSVLVLFVISIIYNFPRFFEYRPAEALDENNKTIYYPGDTALRLNLVYRYLYNTALYCVVMYIIPLVTLAFLNYNLVRQMRAATRRWAELNRLQQREFKATSIPICIVVLFSLTGSQSLVSFVLDSVFVHEYIEWMQRYTAVANLLVIINSAANFIIFYIFGSKFRALLRRLCACGFTAQAQLQLENPPIFRKRFNTMMNDSSGNSSGGNFHFRGSIKSKDREKEVYELS